MNTIEHAVAVAFLVLASCASFEANVQRNAAVTAPPKPPDSKLYVIGGVGEDGVLSNFGSPSERWTLATAGSAVCGHDSIEMKSKFLEAAKAVDWDNGPLDAGPFQLLATADFTNSGEGHAAASREELTARVHELARSLGADVIGPHKVVERGRGEVKWVVSFRAYFYRIACDQ